MNISTVFKNSYSDINHCRFVVLSDSRGHDCGINEFVLNKLFQEISTLTPQPSYIIFPGDLVTGSKSMIKLRNQLESFKQVFSSYYPVEMLLPVIGNHEVKNYPEDDCAEFIFSKVFREFQPDEFLHGYNRTVYYVDICNTRLIVLNSHHYDENNEITGEQLEWLKEILKEPVLHKIVFVHTPPFPTGAHYRSPLGMSPCVRDKFWSILDKNNVALIFTGHEHNYSRRIIDESFSTCRYKFRRKVHQIITGGAGAPLRDSFRDIKGVIVPPIPVYHFVVVDINETLISVTALSINGEIIDNFTLQRTN